MARPKWGISKEQLQEIVDFVSKPENMVSGIVAGTGSGKSTNMIETFFENNAKIFRRRRLFAGRIRDGRNYTLRSNRLCS